MADRRAFRFGVTAHHEGSGAAWRAFGRKVEGLGFTTLLMPDHLGEQLAPVPALAAAAEATRELRVGTLVACNDFRHPVVHAKEVATLDLLSGGRVEWGMGAGWLAPEYQAAGIPFDRPPVRVERLAEAVRVMKGLFADGAVSHEGAYYRVTGAEGYPKPVQRPHPRLLVGGARKRLLELAGREADIVGVQPAASTSTAEAVDRQLGWVRAAAGRRLDAIEISMVAFPAVVTADRDSRAAKLADRLGVEPADVLASPHVWMGTTAQICESLEARRERWGVSYWVVPAAAVDAVAPVVADLAGR